MNIQISPSFTVEDIRVIRDKSSEKHLTMTDSEIILSTREAAMRARKRMDAISVDNLSSLKHNLRQDNFKDMANPSKVDS